MVVYYYANATDKKVKEIDAPCKGCWIHLEHPSDEEITHISVLSGVSEGDLRTALDPDEVAHLEVEDNYRVIIIDVPKSTVKDIVHTVPLALIQTDTYIITVCSKATAAFKNLLDGKVKSIDTNRQSKFIYQAVLNICRIYLFYLRQIDKKSDSIQKNLSKSMQNKEVLQLLDIQKTIVYFSASLTANFSVIQKISYHAGNTNTSDEERDILEDIVLDSKQSIEMCSIYREIIKSTMDAFGSVVNNNQNTIMKFLTAMTIILAIPTLIASFWGMNTHVPWEGWVWGFWIVTGIALLVTTITAIIMIKKKMF